MLDLESRMEILGVTVFRDHGRPEQFYYLPGPPRLSVAGGSPLFDLFAFQRGGAADDVVTGGFLNMTVDVGLGALRSQVERRLREQFGDDAVLAGVPFTKGSAKVIGLGEDSSALLGEAATATTPEGAPLVSRGPRFIERILGAGQPSMDGDHRAIFSFSLSQDGAAFFLGTLEGSDDAAPIGAVYEFEYVGLLPAYDLKITIDFESSYAYLRNRFTLGTLLFRADLDHVIEDLQRRENIRIEEVARTLELSTPEAIAARQQRIDQLVKDLATGALFQPSLVPGEPRVQGDTLTAADPTDAAPVSGAPGGAAAALQHGASAAVTAGLGEALNPSGRRAGAGTGAGGAADGAGTAGAGTGEAGAGGAAGGAEAGGAGGGANGGSSGTPTTAADVWNRLGRPQAAYVVKDVRQTERRTVTYNLSQVTAQKQTVAPQSFVRFLGDERELQRRVHLIDLNHPFFQRLDLHVGAQGVDFEAEGITQLTVQLRYGTRADGTSPKDTAEVILRRPADGRDLVFFLDGERRRTYEYRLVVDYRHGFGIGLDEVRLESPWITSEATTVPTHPRQLGRVRPVTVHFDPNPPEDVLEMRATVRYVHEARAIDDAATVTLSATARERTVPIRLAEGEARYQVETTVFYRDGSSEALTPVVVDVRDGDTTADAHVVEVPRANRLAGDILMVDALGELRKVLVDTSVAQGGAVLEATTFELEETRPHATFSVRLPHRDTIPTLEYRERRLYRDGGVDEGGWREAATPHLVVGVPASGVMTVVVRYLAPPPSSLGLAGILVDLEYGDPETDRAFAQRSSLFIDDRAESHQQEWRVRLPDRQATTYRWRTTLLLDDGSETVGAFETSSRQDLILRPRL